MIKIRRRSTACKMALAGIFTALVFENSVQNGLFVPAHAIEQDLLDSWQEYMQDFDSMLEEADAKLNTAYDELNNSLDSAAEDVAQNIYNAALTQYSNLAYMIQYMTISSINAEIQVPQPGSAVVGWYMYNNEWFSCTVYQYENPVEMGKYALCTSSKHFYSAVIAPDADGTIRVNQNVYSSSYYGYFCTVNGVYTNWAGIASNLGDYNTSRWFSLLGYRPGSPGDDLTNMIDAKQISQLQLTGQDGYYPSKFLGYRNDMPQSISPIHLSFIPGTVSGFIDNLKTDLVDNYGQDAYDDITVIENSGDIPDVGTLDSLTFPSGLPSASFNDVELPSEPLPAKMISGAGFWFTQFSNMLDALGVKYIVITFLIIALIMAILKI